MGMILVFNRGSRCRDYQHSALGSGRSHTLPGANGRRVVLGFGDIGRHVAKRLAGFDCQVIAFRTVPRGDEAMLRSIRPFGAGSAPALLDYLSVPCPIHRRPRASCTRKRLRRLPKHAVVINVGRGSLIPEQDPLRCLRQGNFRGGLDAPAGATGERAVELAKCDHNTHNSGLPVFKAQLEILGELGEFCRDWAPCAECGRAGKGLLRKENPALAGWVHRLGGALLVTFRIIACRWRSGPAVVHVKAGALKNNTHVFADQAFRFSSTGWTDRYRVILDTLF